MAEARRDENYVASILGISNADGSTLSPYIDSITHRLLVNTTGVVTISSGSPVHFSGSVTTTPADTITPSSNTLNILIENTHATQNILISLDGGTSWKTIRPYGVLSIDASVASFKVKGSGAATTYEGVYLV